MANSAERKTHDVDMPTIVKGLLNQLPHHNKMTSHGSKLITQPSLLGAVAVNRIDSIKFDSTNFASTNLMR